MALPTGERLAVEENQPEMDSEVIRISGANLVFLVFLCGALLVACGGLIFVFKLMGNTSLLVVISLLVPLLFLSLALSGPGRAEDKHISLCRRRPFPIQLNQ